MRNIIIVGPSRSGKSTLAKRLHEELGYYVISIDKLVAVFQNAYPELDIKLNWDRDKVTENIAPFIAHYLGMFSSDDGRGLLVYSHGAVKDNRFVLEGAYFDFGKIEESLKVYGINSVKEGFILIGLVQKDKSEEDFIQDFRKYDTEDDWTYNLSDEELKEVAIDMVSYNKEMYRKLVEYGFDIYDTSGGREEVFDKIIEKLRNK